MGFTLELVNYSGVIFGIWTAEYDAVMSPNLTPGAIWTCTEVAGGTENLQIKLWEWGNPVPVYVSPYQGPIYDDHDYTYDISIGRLEDVTPSPPECVIDADCPPGFVCVDSVCVPESAPPNGEEKAISPLLFVLGGAGLILVALVWGRQ